MKKRRIKSSVIGFGFLLIFLFSFKFNAYAAEPIDEVRGVLKKFYVDEIPDSVLQKPTIDEIIKELNDPYTDYFTKEEYEDFINSINNDIVGIGIRIEYVPEGVKVISFSNDSPAKESGILEGDIITGADGTSFSGLKEGEALKYIKGKEGTYVKLSVKRGSELHNFNVKRKAVHFKTVEGKITDGNVGYISIYSFGEQTPDEFYNVLSSLKKSKPEAYIIDLRNNPGGYLNSALKMAGYFVGNKPILITEDRISGKTIYYSSGYKEVIKEPVAFLINENSASASEVLSASVKDYKRGFFIGNKTFGKGLVQTTCPISDDGVLKFTIQRFYSPYGNEINKKGIAPDLYVKNADPLKIATLLYAKTDSNGDNVFVSIGGRCFRIPSSLAAKKEYEDAFKYILESANVIRYEGKSGEKLGALSYPASLSSKLISLKK